MKQILLTFLIVFIINIGYSQDILRTWDTIKLEAVPINASYSATKTTPFTFQNLSLSDIALKSKNSEPAVLFNTTPSVTFYSDAGIGVGYTYFRLRGIDQTRINSTFNGVPLNDPEDQGIYYNNFTGLMESIGSIQIIRGAGISKPGISSYGGSINFNSSEFSDSLIGYAKITHGSYNTHMISEGVNNKHFMINVTASGTDGYRDRVWNNSLSTFYGTTFDVKKSKFILYGFASKQSNGMGWLGETLDIINKNPKFNTNTEKERDLFKYYHNQLIWKYRKFKTVFYYTHLEGKYGIELSDSLSLMPFGSPLIDTINLKSDWFGTNINYNIIYNNLNINSGINTYTYKRNHWGDYGRYGDGYSNYGIKNSLTPYIKASYFYDNFTLYGDIQYRYATFKYVGNTPFNTKTYNFLDWSAGLTYSLSDNIQIYYGIGKNNKEPKRTDYFGGCENFDSIYYTELKPEELISRELGIKYNNNKLLLNFNLYYMKFKNEMSLTGFTGYNSISLSNINIDKSYRSGIEIESLYKLKHFKFNLVTSFSLNKIFNNNFQGEPILTPKILTYINIHYNINKFLYSGVDWKYNGKCYIDFENLETLPSYNIINIYSGIYIKKNLELRGDINNLLNNIILGNAYMGGDGIPRYYVMAGINGMLTLTMKF